ncbi:MAG: hypothetical protein VXZ82_24600 [Planctomycetota bacterium]|nr:hypothetical protein [Planctomycetota bacterium]
MNSCRQLRTILYLAALIACTWACDPAAAQDASGVWKGKWTEARPSGQREFTGSLRIKLQKTGSNTYRGNFSGRFAIVIPYFYRADVVQYGHTLYSSKKLGPLGEYRMLLRIGSTSLNGGWNTAKHHGSIRVRR